MRLSYSRDLSRIGPIEHILADIPYFTVGILALCTLSFFVAMKRLNLFLVYIHASIFAAFISALLHLSQVIMWTSFEHSNPESKPTYVSGIIIAREVGFGFSTGLRLLFYWAFVAQPPRAEQLLPMTRKGIHSGAWNRWGIIGTLLQWATGAMIVAVFVIQLIWRIEQDFIGPTNLYNADAGIEIILSAVFLLKLGLNTSLCISAPKIRVMMSYSGFIIALILSIGIGLGNLVTLKFMDSVLGRFLEAIEFYILILSALIATFYPIESSERDNSSMAKLPITIPPMPRESTFHITPPNVSTPHLPPQATLGPVYDAYGRPILTSRESSASRISSWLATRSQRVSGRFRRVQENDEERLWDQAKAERGESPTDNTSIYEEPYRVVSVASTDYVEVDRTLNGRKKPSTSELRLRRSPSPRPSSAPYSEAGESRNVTRRLGSPETYSPVFGLNGIAIGAKSPFSENFKLALGSRSSPAPTFPWDRPASGVSSLMRQQTELDKSIAALRIFDNKEANSTQDEDKGSPDSQSSFSGRSKRSKIESTSAPSEISLSNFPRPPWDQEAETMKGARSSTSTYATVRPLRRQMSTTQSVAVENVDFDMVPPQMPAAAAERTLSIPYSDSDSEIMMSASVRTPKFDSHGTQYDVTSFIGNLTQPGHKKGESESTRLSNVTSDDEAPATIVTVDRSNSAQYARPTYVGSPLASVSGVGRGVRTSRIGLPPRPKLQISSPVDQGEIVTSPGAFEAPRSVPSPRRGRPRR